MRITINGKDADIRLENEQTVGDVLAGLGQWLANTGHRPSGMVIDGEAVRTGSLEASFGRNIDSVKTLDILTSSLMELTAESLLNVLQDIADYEAGVFEEKQRFREQWEESSQARLLGEQIPELFSETAKTFSGEGLSPAGLRSIIEERLRELRDPAGELEKMEPLIAGVCARLEDLPLDIQTGKDARAAETIQFFSGIAGKIFRVYRVLQAGGFAGDPSGGGESSSGVPLAEHVSEFGGVLKELLAAYEQRDTVLVGDLAEYELAPRLKDLYAAIKVSAVSA
ncbi:MAG: hypothetical protein LBS37_02100 [Treponema sp.]|jgi:hypothetical protein|nr:hypothetical protein [Treponema sp.]